VVYVDHAPDADVKIGSTAIGYGWKRDPSNLVFPDYAKYGMGVGRLPGHTTGTTCGIVSSGWPTWVLAAQRLNMNIVLVVVKEDGWTSRIEALVPGVRVEIYQNNPLPRDIPPVSLWLCDVEPPRGFTPV
jgi:hypothetical protein